MKLRMGLSATLILLLSLFFWGCGEQDTGDRRIDMRLWYYNPAQPAGQLASVIDTEINVFVDEHWSGFFSDSYNSVEDANVTFNDEEVPFQPSMRGYSELNLPFAPGENFTLDLELGGNKSYTFADSIPDISVHGLPSERDTVLTPSDTLRITWWEVPNTEGRLDIIRDGTTVETYTHRKVFRWSPKNSYRGEEVQLNFHWVYRFKAADPFHVMQYEYVAKHVVEVE